MKANRVPVAIVVSVVVVVGVAGCGGFAHSGGARTSTPLAIIGVPVPPLQVRRFDTTGTYPQVRRRGRDLRAVNRALRDAVLADQRLFARYARRQDQLVPPRERGDYSTALKGASSSHSYLSASTAVASVLFPRTHELFPAQHGADGWLAITVRVPSGTRVTITDLFSNPQKGIRALASAWQQQIRSTEAASCLRAYAFAYTPTAANYRAFALTHTGIAVGTQEIEACYRLSAIVPYSAVRPYLNKLGSTLVAGVERRS